MLEDMFTRIENAQTDFINLVVDQFKFTPEEATKILAVYKKMKIAKLVVAMGRYDIVHGAYWDKEVMQRALEMKQ